MGLGVGHEFFPGLERGVGMDVQGPFVGQETADELIVVEVEEVLAGKFGGRQGRGDVTAEDRIAVRLGTGDIAQADLAARTGLVLDDEGLAQDLEHPVRQDAAGHVDHAAHTVGDHEGHRLCGRAGVGHGRTGQEQDSTGTEQGNLFQQVHGKYLQGRERSPRPGLGLTGVSEFPVQSHDIRKDTASAKFERTAPGIE